MKTIFTFLFYANVILASLYITAKLTEWLIPTIEELKSKKIRKEDK